MSEEKRTAPSGNSERLPPGVAPQAPSRRLLLMGLGSLIVSAPAIVRASSLMSVKLVDWTPLCCAYGPHYAGWVERLGYQCMDNILKTGYTPERAASFYGGMSEEKMRSAVAYARLHGFLK
jgi:hypothetical protein